MCSTMCCCFSESAVWPEHCGYATVARVVRIGSLDSKEVTGSSKKRLLTRSHSVTSSTTLAQRHAETSTPACEALTDTHATAAGRDSGWTHSNTHVKLDTWKAPELGPSVWKQNVRVISNCKLGVCLCLNTMHAVASSCGHRCRLKVATLCAANESRYTSIRLKAEIEALPIDNDATVHDTTITEMRCSYRVHCQSKSNNYRHTQHSNSILPPTGPRPQPP
jgi:hypothetical protein